MFKLSAIEKYDHRDFQDNEFLAWKLWDKDVYKCFSNIKYNQKEVDNYSCTGQASCGVISDVTNIILPLSFREKVWKKQLETGAVPWVWDYFQNWMKQAVKLFNEEYWKHLDYELEYIKFKITTHNIMKVLDSWSSFFFWIKAQWFNDSQDNWIIDNPDNKDWWGHAIRWVKYTKSIDELKYCDNYEWVNEYNIVTIPNFSKNKDLFEYGYYIRKNKK